jgi:plastocyanin
MRHIFALTTLSAAIVGLGWVAARTSAGDNQWGTIKGQVVYDGSPPAPAELKVDKDQEHCLSKGKILDETWVVSKAGGIKNVYVWLGPISKDGSLPIHPDLVAIKQKTVEIDQPCCAFIPHALAVREGQTLVVKNSSPIPHNVNYSGSPKRNPGANFLVPAGTAKNVDDLKADRLPLNVSCNIHPWMKAVIRVYDHPYYALTDAEGKFEIKNAPVGQFKLFVWHEGVGWLGGAAGKNGQDITIKAGVNDLGQFKLKAE